MPITIYFNNRPLILSSSGDLVKNDDMIFRFETPGSIQAVLSQMSGSAGPRAILLGNSEQLMLEALKNELKLIVAAGGLVHTKENKVLMIFRKGKWDLPKGKLDEGEDLETCALREITEETAIDGISIESPLCITYHTYHQKGEHILKESHWYLVSAAAEGKPKAQTEEDIEECLWVPLNELTPYIENAHASVADVLRLGISSLEKPQNV